MQKTKLIAAYPCMGKTTLTNLNRDRLFDREIFESRSVLGMNEEQEAQFFYAAACMIDAQVASGYYDTIFITEDDRLINRLLDFGYEITIVFPDVSTARALHSYRNRVLDRSGADWWDRVLAPEINSVQDRIRQLRNMGCSVIVADEGEYLEDVIDFGDWLVRPKS